MPLKLTALSLDTRKRLAAQEHAPLRSTLSIEGHTAAVLEHQGDRLGLSPMQLASLLLNDWASDQLSDRSSGTAPTERFKQLLQRYGLNLLTADQLIPRQILRDNVDNLTDQTKLLNLLKTGVQPEHGAELQLYLYLKRYLQVPTDWLLGDSPAPASAWPTGFNQETLKRYLSTNQDLLLIKSVTVNSGQLLHTPGKVLVAAFGKAERLTAQPYTSASFDHLTPLGIADLSRTDQRQALMAAILANADINGLNVGMHSANIDPELLSALQDGSVHPDDHIRELWHESQEWNAYRLTVSSGQPEDVNWTSHEDKAAARRLLEAAQQKNEDGPSPDGN